VRTAQVNWVAGDQNAIIIDTDDLIPLITTYHYSANNIVTLGKRCASAVLGLLGIEDTPQSHPWTVDGDGIGFPQTAAEWNAVLAAAGVTSGGPFRITDCTVASGNLPDLLGGPSLVPSGTAATYQAAVPGFTRTGVKVPTDAATTKFGSTDTSLPDPSAESIATLSFVRVNTAPGSWRNLTTFGSTVKRRLTIKAGGVINDLVGNTNNTVGTALPTGALRPFVTQHDRSVPVARFLSDQETFTTTWDPTIAGKQLEIVGDSAAPAATTMYEASFRGAAAQKTLAEWKAILTTLGFILQF
jgi:hypothetical protein